MANATIGYIFNSVQMYLYSFIMSQPGGARSFLCQPLKCSSSLREVMDEEANEEVSSDTELSLE